MDLDPEGSHPRQTFLIGPYLIGEVQGLRAEIIQHINIEFLMFWYTITAAGTAYSFGLGLGGLPREVAPIILLLYPFLAYFMAARLSNASLEIARIGQYIREQVEPPLRQQGWAPGQIGWETYNEEINVRKGKRLATYNNFETRGIFVGTQAVALALAVFNVRATVPVVLGVIARGDWPSFTQILFAVAFVADLVIIGMTYRRIQAWRAL
ncbi:MAG TPA: hypothetical protein VID73_02880 [Ktedonobacterales bacterium]